MNDELSDTQRAARLPRSLKDKILESEFGKNWRNWRWWASQFSPTSITILLSLVGFAGTWIVSLSHKVDNQSTRIVVLETQIVPDLKLGGRVSTLENTSANHEGRIGDNESDIRSLQAQMGKFSYPDAIEEANKVDAAHRRSEPMKGKRK